MRNLVTRGCLSGFWRCTHVLMVMLAVLMGCQGVVLVLLVLSAATVQFEFVGLEVA